MKVTEAKYARRFKLEEYEWEEHTLTAVVEHDETGAQVLSELKSEVNKAFTGEVAPEAQEETKKAPAKATKEKKEKKNAKSKSGSTDDEDEDAEDSEGEDGDADDEGSEDDEGSDADSEDDGDSESEEGSEDESEEGADEEENAKPAKGKGAGKKVFVKKPQNYDRKIEQHKEVFARVLKSVAPDWKNSEASKAKAKKASAALEGSKFLDEKGEVVESFKKALKTLWGSKK